MRKMRLISFLFIGAVLILAGIYPALVGINYFLVTGESRYLLAGIVGTLMIVLGIFLIKAGKSGNN